MLYKRHEGFRLIFETPLPAIFRIIQIHDEKIKSNKGLIKIINMSIKGAKVFADLDLPVPGTRIILESKIIDEELKFIGQLIWKKKNINGFVYGMSFEETSYSEQQLLIELKRYVKQKT